MSCPPLPSRLALAALAMALGACAQSPVALIPAGLRATVEQQDRASAPNKPMTVEEMLSRARGATEQAPPQNARNQTENNDPQAVLARARAWTSAARSEPLAPPPAAPQVPVLPTASSKPANTVSLTVRCAGAGSEMTAEDRLRLQIAVGRLPRGPQRAMVRFAPAEAGDAFARLATGRRCADAVRHALPEGLIAGEALYRPDGTPGTVTVDFSGAGDPRG